MLKSFIRLSHALDQCFLTFFVTWHPLSSISIFVSTPARWQNRSKDQWIAITGGTPGTISRHPSVPKHPSWEPLFKTVSRNRQVRYPIFVCKICFYIFSLDKMLKKFATGLSLKVWLFVKQCLQKQNNGFFSRPPKRGTNTFSDDVFFGAKLLDKS